MTEGAPVAAKSARSTRQTLAPFVLRSSSQEMVMMNRCWVHRVRVWSLTLAALVLCAAVAAPAHAQVVQVTRSDAKHSVGFNLGYFMVRGVDSRIDDDVLLADLHDLLFEVDDFNGFTFGGEWLYALSDYVETGVGIGYYQRTVPSVYARLVDVDGTEIAQDLKLRIAPITATVRFLPLGRSAPVEPYIGGGVGFFNWKYSEVGEFVDFSDNSIFPARYRADGTAVGPVIVGGLRFPIGDAFTTGFEYRWQKAEGNTNAVESGLLTDKIDLGGQSFNWTFHIRF
jgi:opacity protein-like surface antigen